ncbi:BCN_G0012290.mRNA.1.CDS.1 [Saccharomyces cerevisiae]|nr:BCN_G0012290.mRNA.1.CDS.1 [Saccharomyces cerevisiae]CAI5322186.1 ALI_HP2_G0031840.mRNA.1.CDS.1 [Saccharomyces cerevisiae]CAI6446144.1 ALI_HP1_G0012350.mRNA.1.CDS.1 [Saccharomyces cerevisiae]CAI6587284.1 ALI_collapsed_G0013160.mRNA.1.CDS.1 [Saccharomyces cerevisiae]CAI6730367.1 ALI_HP2_G0031840.mRNA.1.CDS.1 [Saccharomyces cerevisiae]
MSQDAAVAEQNPEEHLSAVDSASNSVLSTPTNKAERDEIKAYGEGEEHEPVVEIPKRPASAYVTVSIMCIMIAFGGFVFGWDTGTISGFVNQTDFIRRFGMQHKDGSYYLSKVRTGLIVSIFNIGCAIGGIILSKLGDMYGRKVGLIVVVVIYIIGIIIQIASINKWYQYFIGRIISGLGVGGIAVLSPMLISEVSPKHLRGTLVSCYQLMITLGIFLGYCTNYGTKTYSNSVQWRVPLGLGFAWALFMIGGMTFVPESPRYLAEVGKIEEAKRSIAVSNKVAVDDPSVLAEVEAVLAGIEAEKLAGNASWGELFATKNKIFQRLIMGAMIQSLQQLTGDNYFFYYGTTIFKAVGLSDSFETSIVLGIVNFASTFVGIYVVDRYGRRTCLLWGAASMTACMVVYASVGVTRLWPNGQDQPSSKGAGNCMIVFACFYIFCFATTWAPIPFVVNSETFPLRVKSKCMSIAQACNWIWGFLIGFFTPFITGAINFYYGYVFMGCLVFMFFYVLLVVPETKGLTLEEVNTMWEEGVLPWKSASWVPPSRRGANYDAEEMAHDDKPLYKRMFSTK